MCIHNEKLDGRCDYCYLEDFNYFGYDPYVFNLAYENHLFESDKNKQLVVINRKYYNTWGTFKKDYDKAKIKSRVNKIKSIL